MDWEQLKILIAVKTYPIPSTKYDELVCTAGVKETGEFVRLYPINFRDLPSGQQYRKYQWIEVKAQKRGREDIRKESYRPDLSTFRTLGRPIGTGRKGDWSERARYVLAQPSRSMEQLRRAWKEDRTSLGVFKPKEIRTLVVTADNADWDPAFKEALKQYRLWDERTASRRPLRKVPFKFHYRFRCDDPDCDHEHKMSIVDWEVGALFWKLRDQGFTEKEAAEKVRYKFFDELCSPTKDTYFIVGNMLDHPRSWLVLGLFYPKAAEPSLFD